MLMQLRQRSLVNRRLVFRDAELITNYVFPFWDRSWSVRFVLIDVFGGDDPRVLAGALEASGADLRTDSSSHDAGSLVHVPRSEFATLYHFDPWWVFRGKGGVAGAYRDAVIPTNISRPFRAGGATWNVHDVEFAPQMETAVSIEGKDALFRKRTFTKANLSLADAFGPSPHGAEVASESRPSSAKTL